MQIFSKHESEEKTKVYEKDCGKEPKSEMYNCTVGLKTLNGVPSASIGLN